MNTIINLVASNYVLREAGVLPDAWYWADRLLLATGHRYGRRWT